MSLIVILRSEQADAVPHRRGEDVAFLQTYLPVDYSSVVSRDTDPTSQPIGGTTLPGTNVLSLVRTVTNGSSTATVIVSYRYVQVGNDWQLIRYEWGDPSPSRSARRRRRRPPARRSASRLADDAVADAMR